MSIQKIDFGFGIPVATPRKLPKLPRTTVEFGMPAPLCAAPTSVIATSLHDLAAHVVFAADQQLGLHDALIACARSILAMSILLPVDAPSLPVGPPASTATSIKVKRSRAPVTAPPNASGFASWVSYQIKQTQKLKDVGPTCVVTFADGETCRMSTAQVPGKPINAGRGLRLCVTAWQSRQRDKPIEEARALLAKILAEGDRKNDPAIERRARLAERNLNNKIARCNSNNVWDIRPPLVVSCHFEAAGDVIARFDPIDANKALEVA